MSKLKQVSIAIVISLAAGVGAPALAQHPPHHKPPPPAKPPAKQPTAEPADKQKKEDHLTHQAPEAHQPGMTGVLGVSKARAGSGTSWLPDVTPMYAVHRQLSDWSTMIHGNAFLQFIREGTNRGDKQLGIVNWLMGMADRPLGGGHVSFRTMLSFERLTVGECGYPDLLATGEFCEGRPLHDRQHPHDFLMEAAALYERELTRDVALQAYAALAGEPTLGPVAFPHRISALSTPVAPLTHHWLDSTHISYGVLSGGVFGRRWKAEASMFNGREPDQNRFDLDLGALDSVAARVWLMPTDRWSLQVSRGHLNEAEVPPLGGPRRDVERTTASATYHRVFGNAGFWSTTAGWGRNTEEDHSTNAWLVETDFALDARNTLFGRLEVGEKTGEDLVVPQLGHDAVAVSKLHVGYRRRLSTAGMLEPAAGAALSFSAIPDRLEQAYRRGSGVGIVVFVNVRPRAMTMSMPGMRHPAAMDD